VNEYLLSVLLGIVEGLTEFLPVSSTAHLRLTERLLGIHLDDPYWKTYSIVIQLGAILCLPIFFRSRIGRILTTLPPMNPVIRFLLLLFWLPYSIFCLPEWTSALRGDGKAASATAGDDPWFDHPLTLVIIAFVCTAIPSFLLTKVIGKHLESMVIIGCSLLIGGIVMWLVDARFGQPPPGGHFKTEHMEDMTVLQAVWIGICQIASAVFPGTSRSMSTITAGQLAGMSRPAALEFSFFVSMPTMAAATLYEAFRTIHPKHGEPLGAMPANTHEWIVLAIGFVVSFVVALAVVAWFMNWVRQRGFTLFAVYRIIVGIAVLVWVFKGSGM
jgi:undecaprenyl-diphosphatase